MLKILLIDRCFDCMYINDEWNRCWHSEAKDEELLKPDRTIPEWCPLPDAKEKV